jgi:hypothetical protein
MEKKRIKKEIFIDEDEEIIIVKKRKPLLVRKMLEDRSHF